MNLCTKCKHASNCVVLEMDVSPELDAIGESLEEMREAQEESEGNSVFIPEDVVFDVIVTECGDFEEESYH